MCHSFKCASNSPPLSPPGAMGICVEAFGASAVLGAGEAVTRQIGSPAWGSQPGRQSRGAVSDVAT